MNFKQALAWGQRKLDTASIGTARLDVIVLLEDNTGIERAKFLSEPDAVLSPEALSKFKYQVIQRSRQTPLAYVRKVSEFYGRNFYVDERVLEPRPESESLIEELGPALKQLDCANPTVIDVGTGSGALIITAKLEFPHINAIATDISRDSLQVAKNNAATYQVKVSFMEGDLISSVSEETWLRQYVVIANLPYVPDLWHINPSAMLEPPIAIYGGKDGLRLYRRLFARLGALTAAPGTVLTESMPPQHRHLAEIASANGYRLLKTNDFIQLFSCSGRHPV